MSRAAHVRLRYKSRQHVVSLRMQVRLRGRGAGEQGLSPCDIGATSEWLAHGRVHSDHYSDLAVFLRYCMLHILAHACLPRQTRRWVTGTVAVVICMWCSSVAARNGASATRGAAWVDQAFGYVVEFADAGGEAPSASWTWGHSNVLSCPLPLLYLTH